jgi:hypothetical protein
MDQLPESLLMSVGGGLLKGGEWPLDGFTLGILLKVLIDGSVCWPGGLVVEDLRSHDCWLLMVAQGRRTNSGIGVSTDERSTAGEYRWSGLQEEKAWMRRTRWVIKGR